MQPAKKKKKKKSSFVGLGRELGRFASSFFIDVYFIITLGH